MKEDGRRKGKGRLHASAACFFLGWGGELARSIEEIATAIVDLVGANTRG